MLRAKPRLGHLYKCSGQQAAALFFVFQYLSPACLSAQSKGGLGHQKIAFLYFSVEP